jgi:hypothetical protein
MVIGRAISPNGKVGKFLYRDDEEEVPSGIDYTVIADSAWVGWVRLQEGVPPEYVGALLFAPGGFRRPARSELGDTNPADWPHSKFDDQPSDPWLEAVYLPLEQAGTGEMFTLQIQSKPRSAGIFAIDGLLRHCSQLARRQPDHYPVVRLQMGQYESRKYGMQWKPVYQVVGKTPKSSVATPDTSVDAQLNDSLPF